MLRLLPTCKGRHFPKPLHLLPTRYLLYPSAANYVEISSNGIETKQEELDFELLYQSCSNTHTLKGLHALLIVSAKAQSVFVATRLINLYARMGEISLSCQTFDQIPRKDVYAWNSMISAYVHTKHFREGVNCLYSMLSKSEARPDFYTFPPVLKACSNLTDGKRIHCWASKLGFEWDVYVAASLVHMYCRFDSISAASKIFKDMPFRDMGSWNAMISGLCKHGNDTKALGVLDEMRQEGIEMNPITVATILPICAQENDIVRGMLIHLYAVKHGMDFDLFVSNALINMYAKLGKLGHAQTVFSEMVVRDLVSWNSIIDAYEQNDDPFMALELFKGLQSNGFEPDMLTLASVASSVAQSRDFQSSRAVHAFILRRCWIMEDGIIGNAVVDMYAKLGILDSARKVFEEIPYKDVVSWNTIITGYAQNGISTEAIRLYSMMGEHKDLIPNQGTWVGILPAYADVGALKEGMKIHGQVLKVALHPDIFVGTCLLDLYGKCGRLDDAMSFFYEVPRMSSVPWNAIISCHGIHGHGQTSLQLFRDMLAKGVKPDLVTFVSLLSACSHSGLVDQGQWCFNVMQEEYGIKPSLKHYGCMVDLLGRAGRLDMAYNLIKSMPIQPDASVWGALLGACRIHGNVELGKVASDCLFDVDSENVGYYVLLSNIYANVGKWEGVNEVRSLARERGLRKTPGWSSIELNNIIEVFYTGNQSHPQCEEIYRELGILTAKMKILGYIPDYSFVLQDVEEDEKQNILSSHSERLAIVYGIINTPPKTPIRIFKNLRVCGDCHNATKYISMITEREIIVRDAKRFHHVKDGFCSCGDYW